MPLEFLLSFVRKEGVKMTLWQKKASVQLAVSSCSKRLTVEEKVQSIKKSTCLSLLLLNALHSWLFFQ